MASEVTPLPQATRLYPVVESQFAGLEQIYFIADSPDNRICFRFSSEKIKETVAKIFHSFIGPFERLTQYPETDIPGEEAGDGETLCGITLTETILKNYSPGDFLQTIVKELGNTLSPNEPSIEVPVILLLPTDSFSRILKKSLRWKD